MESISGAFPFCNPLTSPSSGGGRGGEGEGGLQKFFEAPRASVWSKNKGRGEAGTSNLFLKELESSRNGNGRS